MPPDDPERSELDEALFGGSGDRPPANPNPRPPDDEDLSDLDSELFGESAPGPTGSQSPTEPRAARRRRAAHRGRRFGLGVLVVLLVVGLGGAAYALFGGDDTKTPAKAKVVVQGSHVTRTTLRPTTTSSTTTTTSSTTTTTTTVPPTTTRAPAVVPETDPPITDPPATDPPPTEPPTTPPTEPPPTTATTTTT